MSDNKTVREIANYFGISLKSAYELVKRPGFPAFRVGGKILVPVDQLQRWIAAGGTKKSFCNDSPERSA